MIVYDTANKLAQEIKESQEYLEFKKVREELEQNQELKQKIDEFEKSRYELQLNNIKGQNENNTETLEKFQKIYMDLVQDSLAKRYFELEIKFNIMLSDVNRIIAESVKDVLKK